MLTGSNPLAQIVAGTEGDDVLTIGGGENTYNGLGGADRFVFAVGPITSVPSSATIDGGAGVDLFDVVGTWRQTYTYTNFNTGLISTVIPALYMLTAGPGGAVRFSADLEQADSQSGALGVIPNGAVLQGVETARFVFSDNPNSPGDFAVLGGAGWYRFNPNDIVIIGNLTGTAMTGAITFDGGVGDDQLNAVAAVNVILGSGGAGNDILFGGLADDVLNGGDGSDRLSGGAGANILDGGAGDDRVEYVNAVQGVHVDLNDGTVSNNGYGLSDTLISIEHLTGSAFNDVLVGNAANNNLVGGAGADVLIGLEGDDLLEGGGGANTMQGGRGDDFYIVSNAGDTLLELAGEGRDTVQTTLSVYRLRDNFEDLDFIGAGPFTGLGNAGDNYILGREGGDTLIGYAGADILIGGSGAANTLIGGLGDDAYFSDAVGDTLIELAGEGYDTVYTGLATYTLRDNFEQLILTQAPGVVVNSVGVGNASDNSISGNAGANTLSGLAGDDILLGHDGDDMLRGGAGLDVLNGGQGVDTADYSLAAGGVQVDIRGQFAANDGDGGTDTLTSIENATGSAFDDTLAGDYGRNVLNGGLGHDVLAGYDGDDLLIGGAGDDVLSGGGGADILEGGLGTDTVDYATSPGAATIRLDLGLATDGYGSTDTLTGVENAIGSAFNDLIFGDAGANVLNGGAGRDTLLGGLGNDTLIGGAGAANEIYGGGGDDRYIVSTVGDTLIEYAGEGTDTVETVLATFTLGANLENLIFTGAGGFTGRGNALDNVLTGGGGNDVLTGLGGNDTINGGLGDDTVIMSGTASDYVITWGAGFATISDNTAGRDGVDTLWGIEHVRFGDGSVLDLTPPAAPALLADTGSGLADAPIRLWEDLLL